MYEGINLQLISDAGKRETKSNRDQLYFSSISLFHVTLGKQLTKTSKAEANYV